MLAQEPVTPRVEDTCCVSGVKGAGVPERNSGPIEFSIDRTGGDYRNIDVKTDATGAVCAQACEAEQRCRAWTYVRPGYLGPSARCFLKERADRAAAQAVLRVGRGALTCTRAAGSRVAGVSVAQCQTGASR